MAKATTTKKAKSTVKSKKVKAKKVKKTAKRK